MHYFWGLGLLFARKAFTSRCTVVQGSSCCGLWPVPYSARRLSAQWIASTCCFSRSAYIAWLFLRYSCPRRSLSITAHWPRCSAARWSSKCSKYHSFERLVRVGDLEASCFGFANGAVETIRRERITAEDAPDLIVRRSTALASFSFLLTFEADCLIHQTQCVVTRSDRVHRQLRDTKAVEVVRLGLLARTDDKKALQNLLVICAPRPGCPRPLRLKLRARALLPIPWPLVRR